MTSPDLEEIRKIIEQHEKRISELESQLRAKPAEVKKELSIKEFVFQKQPKGDVEKTLVIGYFLENYRNVSPLTVADIESGFLEAKEPVPGNTTDKVGKNVGKGLMMKTKQQKDGRDAWILTSVGERVVENDMGKK